MVVEKKKIRLFNKLRGRISNRETSSKSQVLAVVKENSAASIRPIETSVKNFDSAAIGVNCPEADEFENALKAYDSKLSLVVKELGADHLDVAALYFGRAGVYMKMFDWNLAIEDFKIAAKIRMDKLEMNDKLVIEVLRNLSHAMEQEHVLTTETNISSKYVSTLTSDLRGSICGLMGGIEEFCEDLEDDIHADHEVASGTENCSRKSLASESMKNWFRDFEEKLDASLQS